MDLPVVRRYANLFVVSLHLIISHVLLLCILQTTLARAAAGASGVAFLSLSPADVYASSYVGEAEAVVRRVFSLARSASPCIIFFDEIDSIVVASASNRSGMERGNNAEGKTHSVYWINVKYCKFYGCRLTISLQLEF
jgi:SpoVK/Ycf46/Vps4 family AAA+-type ATPase